MERESAAHAYNHIVDGSPRSTSVRRDSFKRYPHGIIQKALWCSLIYREQIKGFFGYARACPRSGFMHLAEWAACGKVAATHFSHWLCYVLLQLVWKQCRARGWRAVIFPSSAIIVDAFAYRNKEWMDVWIQKRHTSGPIVLPTQTCFQCQTACFPAY